MKKVLSLVLALLMCAFVFAACDDLIPAADPQGTTAEQSSETEAQPSAPIKIDDLNGKTPKQLYVDLSKQFPTFTSFEYSMSEEDSKYIMRVSGENSYFWTDVEGTIECIIVDGVGYLNDAGEKLKYVGQTLIEDNLDDYIPSAWTEELFYELFTEHFANHLSFDGVEMYLADNDCYFTVTMTESDEVTKFTVHFDKNGILTSFLATEDDETIKLSNINKPVEITVPANADTYPEYDPINQRGLALYKQICQKLSTATSYHVSCNPYTFSYYLDSDGDERVETSLRVNYYKKGDEYFSATGEKIDTPTQDIVDLFAEGRSCASEEIQETDMTQLNLTSSGGSISISISKTNGEAWSCSFDEDMSVINVYSHKPENYRWYIFSNINTDAVDIQIPTVG